MSLVLPKTSQHQSGSGQPSADSPLATLLLITYQHEAFVAEAVRSALAQSFSPLQIVISDDCSSDGTWEIIQRECMAYTGPHQVLLNRNSERRYLKHWQYALPLVKGRYLILGCGDDIFMPNRVSANVAAFQDTGAAVVVSNCVSINDAGVELGLFQDPNVTHDVSLEAFFEKETTVMLHGASMAWDTHIIKRFGPLPVMRNIDWLIPFRGLLLGGNHYISEPLMYYRFHEGNSALGLRLQRIEDALERERIKEAQYCQSIVNDHYMNRDITTLGQIEPAHPKLSYLERKMSERQRLHLDAWVKLRSDWVVRGVGV